MPGTANSAAEWVEDRDAFVTAIAELLPAGPHAGPLTHPQTVLAARDRVVGEVRTLVGVLSGAGPEPTPVTLHDLVERPAMALAAALRLLPTPAAYQQVAPSDPPPPHVSEYERRWHQAARPAVMLEQHADTLRHLPPDAAGQVLTQLADVAAALGPLDTDLARACQATAGPQAHAHMPALTDRTAHSALRLCATEVQLRTAAPASHAAERREPERQSERAGAPARMSAPARHGTQPRAAVVLRDLGVAMSTLADGLGERESLLSVPELRAVAALVETGAAHVATVLRRVAPTVSEAQDVADALLPLVDTAAELRRVPVRSLAPPRVELPALCGELRRQLSRLAALATRLPHATGGADLQRLATPALAWATQVQPVTDALAAVRNNLDAGVLAVPTELPTRRGPALLWAPASSSAEPPRVLVHAHHLRVLVGRVSHAAQQAATRLPTTTTGPVALTAAAAAGTAHSSLAHALATRASDLDRGARDPLADRPPKQTGSPHLAGVGSSCGAFTRP